MLTLPRKYEWSDQAMGLLKERYLAVREDGSQETPEEMCRRVAKYIASAEKTQEEKEKWEAIFFDMMASKECLPNSPALMNAGIDNKLGLSACYVLPIDDSLRSIYKSLGDSAIIFQAGGGVGFSFSRLRAEGTPVSQCGTASGPISFLKVYDTSIQHIKQGGKRRGAAMATLRVDHPDVEKFIDCKRDGGITNFNISVMLTNEFMDALKADSYYNIYDHKGEIISTKFAKKIWNMICSSAHATGDPGIVFIDNINNSPSHPVHCLGLIETTNACTRGSSLMLTSEGLKPIRELVGKKVNVWNGEVWAPCTVWSNGVKPVYRMELVNGMAYEGTLDHRLSSIRGEVCIEDAEGSKFFPLLGREGGNWQGLEEITESEAVLLGFLQGDGSLHKATGKMIAYIGIKDEDIRPIMEPHRDGNWKSTKYSDGTYHERGIPLHPVISQLADGIGFDFSTLPTRVLPTRLFLQSPGIVKAFLRGLFSANGTVSVTNNRARICFKATSKVLVQQLQQLMGALGMASYITTNKSKVISFSNGDYRCRESYDLNIGGCGVETFMEHVGFVQDYKNEKALACSASFGNLKPSTVRSITYIGDEEVFDFNEPLTNWGWVSSFKSHNCSEMPLYSYGSCNLASINISKFINVVGESIDHARLDRAVRNAVRMLDNMIDVNHHPLKEIGDRTDSLRNIGLGIMGWADALIMLNTPYASNVALRFADYVSNLIRESAVAETIRLATERGPFPLWCESIYKDGPMRRNATLTTQAPTGSISWIAGCSSGIEPLFALVLRHNNQLGREMIMTNPVFQAKAEGMGVWDSIREDVTRDGCLKNGKAAQFGDVFKTAHEIAPEWHVKMQAAFQKNVDTGISKTVNVSKDATVEDISNIYMMAWDLGCKGVTVYRDGCKGAQVLNMGTKSEVKSTEIEKLPMVKKRPAYLSGRTYQKQTPLGSAFITVNDDAEGEPMELFIRIGKAGSDVSAMSEALGRVISLVFRMSSSMSVKERVEKLISQLGGIGGSTSVGLGKQRVRSLPDALAKVLRTHITLEEAQEPVAREEAVTESQGDLCPDCGDANLVYKEGCCQCMSCGYARC